MVHRFFETHPVHTILGPMNFDLACGGISASTVTITWEIPEDCPEGKYSLCPGKYQGSLKNTHLWGGIKQCKYMVVLRDFLYNGDIMTPELANSLKLTVCHKSFNRLSNISFVVLSIISPDAVLKDG